MTAEEQAKQVDQAHMEKRLQEYGDAINANDHARAETIMLEIFQKVALQAMAEEPTQRRTWELLESECEEEGNWIGAEEAQRKVLELALEESNPLLSVKPHLDLAGLYRINGKYEEAAAEIEKALSKTRNCNILHVSLMAVEEKGRLLIETQSFEEADKILREAVASIPEEKVYAISKARVMTTLAHAQAHSKGNHDFALKLLAEAEELIAPYGNNTFMSGLHSARGNMADVAARIHASRGNLEKALKLSENAVRHRTTICEQPHTASGINRYRLAKTLEQHAKYLKAAGREKDAKEALAQSATLLPKKQEVS
jgi:tetratricopeptide (TPR) repeat protein